jgi:hypothetical protein
MRITDDILLVEEAELSRNSRDLLDNIMNKLEMYFEGDTTENIVKIKISNKEYDGGFISKNDVNVYFDLRASALTKSITGYGSAGGFTLPGIPNPENFGWKRVEYYCPESGCPVRCIQLDILQAPRCDDHNTLMIRS